MAFVVREAEGSATAEQVLDACRASLAPYKVPKAVVFVETLPRNATGKLLKSALRQSLVSNA